MIKLKSLDTACSCLIIVHWIQCIYSPHYKLRSYDKIQHLNDDSELDLHINYQNIVKNEFLQTFIYSSFDLSIPRKYVHID